MTAHPSSERLHARQATEHTPCSVLSRPLASSRVVLRAPLAARSALALFHAARAHSDSVTVTLSIQPCSSHTHPPQRTHPLLEYTPSRLDGRSASPVPASFTRRPPSARSRPHKSRRLCVLQRCVPAAVGGGGGGDWLCAFLFRTIVSSGHARGKRSGRLLRASSSRRDRRRAACRERECRARQPWIGAAQAQHRSPPASARTPWAR